MNAAPLDRPEPAPPRRPPRSRLRRLGRAFGILVVVLFVAAGAGALWLRHELRASLPRLEGELAVAGLGAPVTVERDALGIPTVRAAGRRDAAFALGFLHAQERFFQMDLQRRRAAGELSELFGAAAVDADRELRVHRFRDRARRFLSGSPPGLAALIEAYAQGVETGLADLGAPPFEYLLLRTEPAPWRPEDTLLTVLAMYNTLQGELIERERGYGLIRDLMPAEMVDFLLPPGNSWDAPLTGPALPVPPPPGPEVWDLRTMDVPPPPDVARRFEISDIEHESAEAIPGSNAWAVAGGRAAGGGAMIASDMHLDLGLPNIWYRAALAWTGPDGAERRVDGVTLPGVPAVVAGSNGRIAWGFTNSQTDTADLVVIEVDPADPGRYLTPGGPRRFEVVGETIRVAGGEDAPFEVRETIWGPVVGADASGRPLASSWLAHRDGAVGLELIGLEDADTIDEAMALANRAGMPTQNVLVADATGRIGWTIAGRLPQRRGGYDPRFPASWADGTAGWDGLMPPAEAPRLPDPPEGLLWSANARPVGGEELALLGDGGFVTAARAGRIRDRLRALPAATHADMLSIQLDDSAFFLERWRELLVATLDRAGGAGPRRAATRALLDDWSGRAAPGSTAYRLVRTTRQLLAEELFPALTAPCREADPGFDYLDVYPRYEGPLWRLVTDRPPHLLPSRHASWDAALLDAFDRVLDAFEQTGVPLEDMTWGRRNTIALRHPLSRAVPALGRWLDTQPVELPGDNYMPRVVTPRFGASERFAVSPGREEEGYFHMPGGQSGHPLSPHYRDAHPAWVNGEPTPFLPGPAVHTLSLTPAG
jgi:penicillin amidase